MPPSLAVLNLSGSFSETLADLVEAAGARGPVELRHHEASLPPDCVGVVVAAGGVEDAAADAVHGTVGESDLPVVVVGVETDHHLASALVRAGAHEYFVLPTDLAMLRGWMEERVARARERHQAAELRLGEAERYDFEAIVGESRKLRDALARLSRIIPRDGVTVMVTGETGTGKELVARAVHFNGPRRSGPFVEINCAALPATLLEAELFGYEQGAFTDARTAKPGLFESADGGTLFLDEIGDLAPELQVKLLKVLENRTVRRLGSVNSRQIDIRLVAATHVDLAKAVRENRFREDLFYRLNVIPIHLPPLRDRGDDVLLLARHFAQVTAARHDLAVPDIGRSASSRLRSYHWPGNVRELRNAVERAVLLGDGGVEVEDLALGRVGAHARSDGPLPFPAPLAEIERAAARAALAHTEGNKSAAADVLGISRTRLYRLLDDA